jgi:hypothetical protein
MRSRIFAAVIVAIILSLVIVIPVFAVAGVTSFSAIPADTTMSLKWVKATGYNYTLIRQSTTAYPVSPTGGDGTTVYPSGSSTSAISFIVTGLTAGTTYYYTAWGYNGATYTADGSAAHAMMTTTAGAGTSDVLPTPPYDVPTEPVSTGWFDGLQPFSGFVLGFEQAWGMKTTMMPFTLGIIILLITGVGLYITTKSPLIAIVGDFTVDFGLIAMGLLSPYTLAVVLAFGLGVWGLENIWI